MPKLTVAQGNTHAHRLLNAIALFGPSPAVRWKEDGVWREMAYSEIGRRTFAVAAALQEKGIRAGERVAVWLETCWEWIVADAAIQILGAVTIPIYHSLSAPEASFIMNDCGARGLISSSKQISSIQSGNGFSPDLLLVSVDGGAGTISFSDFSASGESLFNATPDLRTSLSNPPVKPEDLSAIIYTSGTTGVPKGAMITHRNMTDTCLDDVIDSFMTDFRHEMLLHLPMAHIMARNVTVAGILYTGGVLVLAEPEREKLPANLLEVAPTTFVTVPYVLDKFMAAVMDRIQAQGPFKRFLARTAISMGRKRHLASIASGRLLPCRKCLLLPILDRLVLKKIRKNLGGRLKFLMIGGANSNQASVEFFWSIGIPVYEGYGATELTNVAVFTRPSAIRLGTVGKPCKGLEIRLAEDGEVLARGLNLMKGYWNRPEETREAIDDGWYHTGDLGQLDPEGHLKIIDRKKEIYALSTGKNVAPQLIENTLKLSRLVAQAFAIGDSRRYIAALVVPDLKVIQKKLALSEVPTAEDPGVEKILHEEINKAMVNLSEFERVKRFMVIAQPFTIENGMLTPTLKLRRKVILKHYAVEIDSLYSPPSVWAFPRGTKPT